MNARAKAIATLHPALLAGLQSPVLLLVLVGGLRPDLFIGGWLKWIVASTALWWLALQCAWLSALYCISVAAFPLAAKGREARSVVWVAIGSVGSGMAATTLIAFALLSDVGRPWSEWVIWSGVGLMALALVLLWLLADWTAAALEAAALESVFRTQLEVIQKTGRDLMGMAGGWLHRRKILEIAARL